MSIHTAASNVTPIIRDATGALDREATVKQMANTLMAGILCGNLDTSSSIDVIACLNAAPERYRLRTIFDHMDAALYLAKQTLLAVEFSRHD